MFCFLPDNIAVRLVSSPLKEMSLPGHHLYTPVSSQPLPFIILEHQSAPHAMSTTVDGVRRESRGRRYVDSHLRRCHVIMLYHRGLRRVATMSGTVHLLLYRSTAPLPSLYRPRLYSFVSSRLYFWIHTRQILTADFGSGEWLPLAAESRKGAVHSFIAPPPIDGIRPLLAAAGTSTMDGIK